MNDRRQALEAERQQLIERLSKNIVESARTIVEPGGADGSEIEKHSGPIAERMQFEANVALSEVVTRHAPRPAKIAVDGPKQEREFVRFGKNFRSQHMLMFMSIILLIITGMPLKFPTYAISRFVIVDMFGGIENSTLIHRVAAVGLIIVGVWHLGYIIVSRVGRRDFWLMIPRPHDIKDFMHTLQFYIGRKPAGPKFGRFSFIEKFDYWAVYWGMVVMIGSGLILWFKEQFPKDLFDIAREAHSDEGLLATLAIVVWHFYNVHFNPDVFPMSWVWWHGKLTESEMKHHHPLEYAEIVNKEREQLTREPGGASDTEKK